MSNLGTYTVDEVLAEIRQLLDPADNWTVVYSQGIQERESTSGWAEFEGDNKLTITIKVNHSPTEPRQQT